MANESYYARTPQDLIKMYNLDELVKDRKNSKVQKEELVKINKSLKDFTDTVTGTIEKLKDQVDGKITTWFFSGVPSSTSEPEVNWNDDEKQSHVGDLYYDQDTGQAYMYIFEDEQYKWFKSEDITAVEALARANAAQDTADKKRQIFVSQPIPPYQVGDMWIKDDKEIYRCRSERKEGNYSATDWIAAVDYTNDDYAKKVESSLNVYKELVAQNYVTNASLETSIDEIEGKVTATTTKIEEVKTSIDGSIAETVSQIESVTEQVTDVKQKVDSIETTISKTTTTIGDLEKSIDYFKVDLDINLIALSLDSEGYPLSDGSIEVTCDCKFKDEVVKPTIKSPKSNPGIDVSISGNKITFSIKKKNKVEVINDYSIYFTYQREGKNYSLIKKIALNASHSGEAGKNGEDAVLLVIESSRGTVFKNDNVSTILSVVIYKGSERITDITKLKEVFGDSAYIQWKWQRLDEEDYGVISSTDSHLIRDGFSYVLTPEDVDTKVTFLCELIN